MDRIRREDGAGGKYMSEFLKKHVFSKMEYKGFTINLNDMEDASDISKQFVFTTDSYVVHPPIFKGGSIGSLAICGTSNDLAVMGAKPEFFSMSLIIQEGFELRSLDQILEDMAYWLKKIDGKLITGDTKVVENKVGIMVNTSGIGLRSRELERNIEVIRDYREYEHIWVRDCGAGEKDVIIISGNIGEHAAAILLAREDLGLEMDVCSDVYPVWLFLRKALKTGGITAMKDATRGGVAAALNEIAEKSDVGMVIEEEFIPIRQEVKTLCDVLGLDPLNMANEGCVVMCVIEEMAEDVLKSIKKAGCRNARIVGYTTKEHKEVVLKTIAGSKRIIPMPAGDPVPRIC